MSTQLQSLLAEHNLDKVKLLAGDLRDIYLFIQRVRTLKMAKKLLFSKELFSFQKLQHVLRDFSELEFKDNNVYKNLIIMEKFHTGWCREVQCVCITEPCDGDELRDSLKNMRDQERGIDLAKLRYNALKKIFEPRNTVSDLKQALSRDSTHLATNISSFKK